MEKIKLDRPIIVEGKYDRQKLASIVDGEIITTEGFGIFNNSEKRQYIKRISEKGVFILTDSDSAGQLIRSALKGFLSPDKITNIYVPAVKGKEKRKDKPSAEGILGVEGTDTAVLIEVLKKYESERIEKKVTKKDLYALGLSGGRDSSHMRNIISAKIGLPENLPCNSFLEAVNVISNLEELTKLCGEIGLSTRSGD